MNRHRRLLLVGTLAGLSVGWLAPLFLAAGVYLSGFETLIRGLEGANSFPYFQAGWDALRLGGIWCGFAALVWATYGISRTISRATPLPGDAETVRRR